MLAKKALWVWAAAFCAAITGIGCASNGSGSCTVSSGAPCMCSSTFVGRRVCVNGKEYCDCGGFAGNGAAGAAGSTTTTTTAAVTGKGGTKANTTKAAGGAKTSGAGGTRATSTTTGTSTSTGTTGQGGAKATGAGGTVKTSGSGPRIPEITEECPPFQNGNITFMGVSGINMAAGPKAAGPTAPMLFYWHGTGSTSVEYAMMDAAITNGVTSEGGVIISFQGLSGSGNAMCSGTMIFDDGSFLVTDQLFACAVKNHNVDPRRVYVAGCSAGGLFTACMAAGRSSYVAAAVPNSGGFVFPLPFEDDHTPALMTRHGAPGVDMVGVDFSTTSKTADDAFKGRGGFVVNCNHGGMHCGGGVLSAQGWEFMVAHPFGVNPEPWKELPSSFGANCAIY